MGRRTVPYALAIALAANLGIEPALADGLLSPAPLSPPTFHQLQLQAPALLDKLQKPRHFPTAPGQERESHSPWSGLTNPIPIHPGAMILLSDGSLMIQDQGPSNGGSPDWWRFTPDINGDYVNGSWTQLASLPTQLAYAPLYFASAVLPDGRVIIEGGEYNFGLPVWTNKGAIYDPVSNSWTEVKPPENGTGQWAQIGDAQSTLLANGTFMLSTTGGSEDALLNASDLSWTITGAGKADGNDEESWSLLPDGTILTVDTNNPSNPTNAELYDPSTGSWSSAGNTPVPLADMHEIGPQLLLPDGTVYAAGATQHNSLFDTRTLLWFTAPDFPVIGGQQYDAADGSAAVLPSGNVLISAGAGLLQAPLNIFLFDGNQFTSTPPLPNAASDTAFDVFMIVLPTGQVMVNDRSGDIEIYTDNEKPKEEWRPRISEVADDLAPGGSYDLAGEQLSGLTQGAAYGDDYQPSTNYPLVRIINDRTKHVYYARTFNWTSSSVAADTVSNTQFMLPTDVETGSSRLTVVANGIESAPVHVTIGPSKQANK
jgi:hypothetical protein